MAFIILEVPDLAGAGELAIRQLLKAALSEFIDERMPEPGAEVPYVDARYPAKAYSEAFRKDKLADVRRRCDLARRMKLAEVSVERTLTLSQETVG